MTTDTAPPAIRTLAEDFLMSDEFSAYLDGRACASCAALEQTCRCPVPDEWIDALAGELDAAITAWSERVEDYEAMRTLQEAGVPAGPSLDVGRVLEEPQLRETGYFTERQTSDGETRDLPGLPWRSDQWPEERVAAAPVLGQDNDYVYRELLGLSEPEVERLVREQVIY